MNQTCPLCKLEPELVRYRDQLVTVVDTLNKKGHRERIMVVYNRHSKEIPKEHETHAMDVLEEIGKEVFEYTYKFVILDSTYGSIKDHWHLVASDLDPQTEDWDKMLGTPWLKVVEVKRWK